MSNSLKNRSATNCDLEFVDDLSLYNALSMRRYKPHAPCAWLIFSNTIIPVLPYLSYNKKYLSRLMRASLSFLRDAHYYGITYITPDSCAHLNGIIFTLRCSSIQTDDVGASFTFLIYL